MESGTVSNSNGFEQDQYPVFILLSAGCGGGYAVEYQVWEIKE
jgi:hypothetical protein